MALDQAFQGGNRVLQGIVSGIAQDPAGYMTQRLVPATPGPHKGIIKVLTGGDHFGNSVDDTAIAPGGKYPGEVKLVFSDVEYTTQKYGKPAKVPDEWTDRGELPLNIADLYLSAATHYLKVMQDYRLASLITSTSWAYAATPDNDNKWTVSTSKPLDQLKAMRDGLVVYPNVLDLGYEAMSALSTHSQITGGMSTSAPHHIADIEYFANEIAVKLGIERVLVWDTRKRASANPKVALTNTNIPRMFRNYAWMGVMSQHPGVQAPNGDLVLNPCAIARVEEEGFTVEQARDFDTDSEKFKVRHKEVIKLVSASLGGLITAAVA